MTAMAPEGRKLLRLQVRNAETPIERKPEWIKTRAKMGPEYNALQGHCKPSLGNVIPGHPALAALRSVGRSVAEAFSGVGVEDVHVVRVGGDVEGLALVTRRVR